EEEIAELRALGFCERSRRLMYFPQPEDCSLLTVVPDVGRELPVASDLLPHHEIFAGDFLRPRTFGLETEGADLARRGGPEWLDVEGCELRIAGLLRHALPQSFDRGSSLHHGGARRECRCVLGVERRDASEIALVEEIYPFRVDRFNLGLLRKRRRNEREHQCDYRSNGAHD